jgi:23S rRNA-/tRNA-specific pseudouridylate synthase
MANRMTDLDINSNRVVVHIKKKLHYEEMSMAIIWEDESIFAVLKPYIFVLVRLMFCLFFFFSAAFAPFHAFI